MIMAKLLGIQYLDYDIANKYVDMYNNIVKANQDFESEKKEIELDSFCSIYNKFSKEWTDLIYLISYEEDGEYHNLISYVDNDDGYRSYVKTIELAGLGQPLLKQFEYEVDILRNVSGQNEINYDILIQYEGKNIFECYTDNSDNYYPVGNIEYHGFQ
jgi:hypothetical protein